LDRPDLISRSRLLNKIQGLKCYPSWEILEISSHHSWAPCRGRACLRFRFSQPVSTSQNFLCKYRHLPRPNSPSLLTALQLLASSVLIYEDELGTRERWILGLQVSSSTSVCSWSSCSLSAVGKECFEKRSSKKTFPRPNLTRIWTTN
jgi:hypothetical protein